MKYYKWIVFKDGKPFAIHHGDDADEYEKFLNMYYKDHKWKVVGCEIKIVYGDKKMKNGDK